jgi:hypothetical protein
MTFNEINNIDNITMNNTNLTESYGVIRPKAKRYQAYDIIKDRNISYTYIYGKAARRIYKQYIEILGYDPEMVIPATLKYYPDSGRFLKQKPNKEKTHMALNRGKNLV